MFRAGKDGINNLMTIYSAVTGKSNDEITAEFAGKGYGDFKTAVGTVVASKGQAGIEKSRESVLAGKNGKLTVEVAGGGAVLPNGRRTEVKATNDSTVKLTIDRDLQNQLMQAVDQSVAANNAAL